MPAQWPSAPLVGSLEEDIWRVTDPGTNKWKWVHSDGETVLSLEPGETLFYEADNRYTLNDDKSTKLIDNTGKLIAEIDSNYRKVTGEEPGARLKTESYGIKDIADMLGITTSSVYDLLQQTGLDTVTVHYRLRVPRKAFDQWYRHQDHYRNAKDRERDRPLEEKSMTVPEMGRLLGLDRREAWKLHYRIKDQLMTIRVANRPRVTRESFEQWYGNQTQYTKVSVPPTASLPPGQEALTEKAEEQRKEYYSLHEAASLLDMSERDLYRMLTYQEIQGKKIGKSWFIRYDDLRSLR